MTREEMTEIDEWVKGKVKTIALVIVCVFLVLVGISCIYNVPAGEIGVIFDAASGGVQEMNVGEGWHLRNPITQSITVMDTRTVRFDVLATAASKDMQTANTKIALNYHVDRSKAWNVYKNTGLEYEKRVIEPTIEEAVRAITAQYTAEELITKREEVASAVKALTVAKLTPYGMLVDGFNIINFEFSPEFTQAIEAKQVAEQKAQMELNVLSQVKIKADQAAAQADGEKRAVIANAEGQASAKLAVATAEALAIDLQGKALKANPEVLTLRSIEKWSGNYPNVMLGQNNVPLINLGSNQ